jgi:DNA-binding NtrC family response regulator
MMNYEYGSIHVESPKLKMILDELHQVARFKNFNFSYIIIGDAGSGKTTMAQYIQKNIFKNSNIEIYENISEANSVQTSPSLMTMNLVSWAQLKSSFSNEKYRVIAMPALKERKADLIALADFFIQVISLMNGKASFKLTEKAHEMILQYNWPGQFYEFESVLENAFEVASTSSSQFLIEPQHLSLNKRSPTIEYNVGMKLEEIERNFILQTLYFVHQNRTKAAEILGISIRTLRNKINQYRQEGFL